MCYKKCDVAYCAFSSNFKVNTMQISSLQELSLVIKKGQPLLAIDHGTKKLGVAVSTVNWSMALPIAVIAVGKGAEYEAIKKMLSEKKICAIIVGVPVRLDGKLGDSVSRITAFT